MDFQTVTVVIDGESFLLKHAETAEQRRQGLAGRTQVDADGMLFSYDYPVYRPFHMRHTYLPLTIAFFNADGYYIGQRQMAPLSVDPYLPPGPFQYAVEFPLGTEPRLTLESRLLMLPNLLKV